MLIKETFWLWVFGMFKIPLLFFLKPTVELLTDERAVVRIPLNWRSKNHLNSMYFGVLAAGADCAGGIIAMRIIHKSKLPISLVFKSFRAEFHQRPTGDVNFVCEEGKAIAQLVQEAAQSGERQNRIVKVVAICPKVNLSEPVATFELELSLKKKMG